MNRDSCESCRYWADPKRPPETFHYMALVFSVERAKRIVADGRASTVISAESLKVALACVSIDHGHVGHVSADEPGIAATVHLAKMAEPGILLIDGHHRAARAVRDGVPFAVRVLTLDETRRVVLRGKGFLEKRATA